MRPVAKVGIVAGGYVAAFAAAWVVSGMYVAATNGPDRLTYGAMYAFGDSLLFLGTFALAGVPATGAALYFLRPWLPFWRVLAALSVGVAFACLVGLAAGGAREVSMPASLLRSLLAIAPLGAPLFAGFFGLAGVFAPTRSTRLYLLGGALVEMVAFAGALLRLRG